MGETYILVKVAINGEIMSLIRTYEDKRRADEDAELLSDQTPERFEVRSTQHIG